MEYYILSPLLFVLRIVEFFSQLTLVLTVSNTNIKFKKLLLGAIVFTISFEIIKTVIPQYLTALLSAIIAVLISTFVFKINYKKSILAYFITAITVAIIDCITCMILLKICNLQSFEELSKSQFLMSIAKIIIFTTVFLISKILKFYQEKSNLYKIENVKSSTLLINGIITCFLLFPNLIMILYYHDNKTLPLIIIIINIIAIILTFAINMLNTQRSIKLVQSEEELITERTYNHTLQHLVDNLRTFKHDSDNTLITIDGYIFTEDWEGLKVFFKDVIKENKNINALNRLNPELFKNPILFGLVTAKFEYARTKDVTMNFEIYADLVNLDMKPYDFTRILGIFLDNAIEAAAGSEKKSVNFYVVERNNKIIIELSNSFSDTNLKIDEIHKKGVSSKGENRGLGLYKVKDILSRYSKIKHETTATNGMFLQRLIVDKVKLPIS